jgi:hypothetical protein
MLAVFCFFPLMAQADTLPETAPSAPEWGDIQIKGELSAETIPQNDSLVFTVRIVLRGNPDDYAISDPGNPSVANLSLIATSQGNRTESDTEGVRLIKEYRYTYKPETIGMAYINPFRIQYIYVPNGVNRNIATSRLEIKITDPILPKKRVKIWPYIIGIVILAGATAVIVSRIRSKKIAEAETENVRSPEEIARESMRKAKKTATDNPENLIGALSRILTIYITNKYGIDARSMSDEKVVEALEMKGVPPAILKNIGKSLDIADKVRFAAMSANTGDADIVELGIESLIAFSEKKNREENINKDEK